MVCFVLSAFVFLYCLYAVCVYFCMFFCLLLYCMHLHCKYVCYLLSIHHSINVDTCMLITLYAVCRYAIYVCCLVTVCALYVCTPICIHVFITLCLALLFAKCCLALPGMFVNWYAIATQETSSNFAFLEVVFLLLLLALLRMIPTNLYHDNVPVSWLETLFFFFF